MMGQSLGRYEQEGTDPMPGQYVIAEEYRRKLVEFAATISPDFVPAGLDYRGTDYDSLRLVPVSEISSCVEGLLGVRSEVPMAWRLGEYWAANVGCLVSARALASMNIGEALEITRQNQGLLTNLRSFSHHGRTDGTMAIVHHGTDCQDPVNRFLVQATMAAKLRVMWDHYSASDRQYPVDLRVPDFGALISRLDSELDFIDIEYRTGELNMGCSRGLLACKVTDRNERLVRALDRELARRAAEIPTTGRWSDRIKYYMRTTELGFNSDASFNMAFKSWTGETPMRFRKAALAKAAANDQESARAGFAGRPRSHGVPQHLSYAAVRPVAIARPLLATYRPCS
jgi:hypothetical protein